MRTPRPFRFVVALLPLLVASTSDAQTGDGDVYWHTDPSVETCSMAIDPALTQAQWATFTRQAGAMISFKSLASAEPLGKGRFSFGVDYSVTPIDQRDPAWINTFTHPDADCPLGDQIEIPSLRARVGVSSRMDVGGYWTTAPGANYGELGGEFRYALRTESERGPAAAVSASFTTLTGVPDFNFNVYSVGMSASKRFAAFIPYLGVRENLAIGTETTDKVTLDQESIPITQGFIGLGYSVWKLGVAAEYNISEVNTLSVVIGSR
ncbi:MAG TPA: hypothetical protein VFS09_13255 [Candidatus Eisenbacteria bacterium]|nr:hypothetical protein [Candidatus Eisenbacteria bacterium]